MGANRELSWNACSKSARMGYRDGYRERRRMDTYDGCGEGCANGWGNWTACPVLSNARVRDFLDAAFGALREGIEELDAKKSGYAAALIGTALRNLEREGFTKAIEVSQCGEVASELVHDGIDTTFGHCLQALMDLTGGNQEDDEHDALNMVRAQLHVAAARVAWEHLLTFSPSPGPEEVQ